MANNVLAPDTVDFTYGGVEIDLEKPRRTIVLVSGGKDSQATLKLAIERRGSDRVLGVFCDTKFEHDLTYQHVRHISQLYRVPIVRLSSNRYGSVPEQVKRYRRLPGGGSRFCTKELKIWPTKRFLKEYCGKWGGLTEPFEVWYGMRLNESGERSRRYRFVVGQDTLPLHELFSGCYPQYLAGIGVYARLPILEWAEQEVYAFLGDDINPLYKQGFSRVGCFPCLMASKTHQMRAFNHDEIGQRHFETISVLVRDLGLNKHFNAMKDCEQDTGCALCAI